MTDRFYVGQRVLVTGVTGFIGARLAASLLEAGAEVHGTTRQQGVPAGVEGHVARLEDDSLPALVRQLRPAVVFHLAARLERDRRPGLLVPMLLANTLPVAALCEAILEAVPLGRLVVLGSAEDYGSRPGPWVEEQAKHPVSPYGLSKVTAAAVVEAAHEAFGLRAVVARPSVVYGPGQRHSQFVPSLIAACLAGERFAMTPGEQLRDFLYVDDLVEALHRLGAGDHFGRAFNLCTGAPLPVVTLARRVHAIIGQGELAIGALPYRATEAMEQPMSPASAHELLGWQARVSLEEGLRRTIAAARA